MSRPIVQAVQDYLPLARQRLGADVWQYLADGDGEGNEQALANVRLMPRPLRELSEGNTRLTLFGQTLEHPLLLAPIAYQRLFHPDGERASAMAASAQGGQSLISSLASQPFADILKAADHSDGKGPWFQLYWQGSRSLTLRLLQRAIAAGCSAVVLTVDAPIKVATLQLPHGVSAANLEPDKTRHGHDGTVFNGWMAQAPTWDDLTWLRQQTQLPLLVKGLLHPDDAEQAVAAGCDGVIVSNHGGRVMAGSTLSLAALARIAARIDSRVPVLFDSGIRHGRHAFVALAHGASAVLVGRPYVWGLAVNGALGVAHVIRLLRDELEMTMALTGCARLSDISPGCLSPS